MIKYIYKQTKTAFLLLITVTVLTGMLYPILVTAIAQTCFNWKANGSIIHQNGLPIGSELIGQNFTDTKHFWGRPSATRPFPYNAEQSSASNLGPSNPQFIALIKSRISQLKKANPKNAIPIPIDLVTASASGLDPDISPAAAYYQVARIAKARHLSQDSINTLIATSTTQCGSAILNDAHLNVIQLNLALDNLT